MPGCVVLSATFKYHFVTQIQTHVDTNTNTNTNWPVTILSYPLNSVKILFCNRNTNANTFFQKSKMFQCTILFNKKNTVLNIVFSNLLSLRWKHQLSVESTTVGARPKLTTC